MQHTLCLVGHAEMCGVVLLHTDISEEPQPLVSVEEGGSQGGR